MEPAVCKSFGSKVHDAFRHCCDKKRQASTGVKLPRVVKAVVEALGPGQSQLRASTSDGSFERGSKVRGLPVQEASPMPRGVDQEAQCTEEEESSPVSPSPKLKGAAALIQSPRTCFEGFGVTPPSNRKAQVVEVESSQEHDPCARSSGLTDRQRVTGAATITHEPSREERKISSQWCDPGGKMLVLLLSDNSIEKVPLRCGPADCAEAEWQGVKIPTRVPNSVLLGPQPGKPQPAKKVCKRPAGEGGLQAKHHRGPDPAQHATSHDSEKSSPADHVGGKEAGEPPAEVHDSTRVAEAVKVWRKMYYKSSNVWALRRQWSNGDRKQVISFGGKRGPSKDDLEPIADHLLEALQTGQVTEDAAKLQAKKMVAELKPKQ